MLILQHIPSWVFVLLLGLIALGLLQTRTRQVQMRSLVGSKIVLTFLTLVAVWQLWDDTPWLGLGLASWTMVCLVVSWFLGHGPSPAGAHYNPKNQRFTVPGSWMPLTLFMTIFACKFGVGTLNALVPDTLHTLNAAIGISALYGLFSGLVNARILRLLKLKKNA